MSNKYHPKTNPVWFDQKNSIGKPLRVYAMRPLVQLQKEIADKEEQSHITSLEYNHERFVKRNATKIE